jgi:hypothetical protein
MEIAWHAWALAPLLVVCAYLVFGLTGFGSTVILVPALAFLLPLRFVVPLVLLLDMAAALLLRHHGAPRHEAGEVKRMLPFMLAGMLLGVVVLARAPERWLMLVLGGFIAIVGMQGLLRRAAGSRLDARWVAPAGFFGGIASSLYGTGGVIYAMVMARRIDDPATLRGTMAALIGISAAVRVLLFLLAGLLLQFELAVACAALLPCVWAGLRLGVRWHARLDIMRLRRMVNAILVVAGAALVLRAA